MYFDSVGMFIFFLSAGRFVEMSVRHRSLNSAEALARSLPAQVTRLLADGTRQRCRGRPRSRRRSLPGAQGRRGGGRCAAAPRIAGRHRRCSMNPCSPASPRRCGAARGELDPRRQPQHRLAAHARGRRRGGGFHARVDRDAAGTRAGHAAAHRARGGSCGVVVRRGHPGAGGASPAALWWPIDPARAFAAVLAVLVVTCPCALSLATPAALAAATTRLARLGRAGHARRCDRTAGARRYRHLRQDRHAHRHPHRRRRRQTTVARCPREQALAISAALERGSRIRWPRHSGAHEDPRARGCAARG